MEWLVFFGHFHPLIVHLPIGFLLVAFALELAGRKPTYHHLAASVSFVLLLSAISAVGASLFGYFLSLDGGYQGQDLNIHKWSGISVAVLSLVLYGIKKRSLASLYMPVFLLTLAALFVTGHFGGNLTHGSGYLTDAAPASIRPIFGGGTPVAAMDIDLETLDSMPLYIAVVHPILSDKCVGCHRPGKMKGELRLDNPEGIRKGGEGGVILVAGDPEESPLIQRVHLPEEHDDHMPPEGKKQLSKAEINLLEWWIAEGANFDRLTGQYKKTELIQQILEKRFSPKRTNPVYALSVTPVSEKRLLELWDAGLPVRPLAQNSPFLELNLANADTLSEAQLMRLKKIGKQLLRLDLSNTNIDDSLLEIVSALPNLTHLHLNGTKISDQSLHFLQSLQYLEYLNLYNTAVTDSGLSNLTALPQLRQVYLWQTEVSEQGIERLQKGHPDLLVDNGSLMQIDTLR